MNLIIQTHKDGHLLKTWKLNSKKSLHVIGHSRQADIYIPMAPSPTWLGFEFQEGQWKILNLTAHESFVSQSLAERHHIPLESYDIWIHREPKSTAHFLITQKDNKAHGSNFASEKDSRNETQTSSQVLILKTLRDKIIQSEMGTLHSFQQLYPQAPIPKDHWQELTTADTNIKQHYRLCLTPNVEEIHREPHLKQLSTMDRLVTFVTLLTLFMGLAFYFLQPENKNMKQQLAEVLPPEMPRPVKLNNRAANSPSMPASNASTPDSAPKGTTLKEAASSRLQSLLKRIQKTQNRQGRSIPQGTSLSPSTPQELAQLANSRDSDIGAKGLGSKGSGSQVNTGGLAQGSRAGLASNRVSNAGGVGTAALESEADIEGGLDPEIIAQVIRSHLGEILFCYERQLAIYPDLFGKMTSRFTINAQGRVEGTSVVQSTLKNATLEKCALQKIERWKFPLPKGGTQVVVTYPFLFQNTQNRMGNTERNP